MVLVVVVGSAVQKKRGHQRGVAREGRLSIISVGARDFSSAVPGFCQVLIVTRAKSFLAVLAFGQHRKFPPHARKTSDTQGKAGEQQSKK